MMLRYFSFTFLLLILSSCSLFIQNFEGDILESNNVKPLSLSSKTICDVVDEDIIISENKSAQKSFNKFLLKVKSRGALKFVDKAVLWSLLQMNLRPDLSSPTSKLQLMIKINNKFEYINSYSEETQRYPYLSGLSHLLKKYKSNYSLNQLARKLDIYFNDTLFVSKEFQLFLAQHKEEITLNKKLKSKFIRGDETLRENERIPKLNYSNIVNLLSRRNSSGRVNNFLFTYKNQSQLTPKCNFDMSLYNDSLFLINDSPVKSHIFGFKSGKNTFMAVSSQKLNGFKTIGNTILLQGESNIRSASICSFEDSIPQQNSLWLISTDSRDPGQHLFHLMQYGLDNIKSVNELNSMLMFSRHQFLKNPVRLIIESRRSSTTQLNELLKLNIPIYNSKKLGKIWGYYQDKKKSTFVLDDRRQGHLECSSK
jgi:hypothetical protein